MPTRRRTRRGFGLLEVILVFAIVIGAAAVVFTVFQSTQPSADSNRATSDLAVLSANIRSSYLVGSNFTGLNNTVAIGNKWVPSTMLSSGGTSIVGTWGLPVTIQPVPVTPPRQFQIVYQGVPAVACTKFVLGAGAYFEDVNIGTSTSSAGTAVRTNNQPMVASEVATACGAGDPLVVTFTSQ
jgi:type II secretory pathway pseudopilin PulG